MSVNDPRRPAAPFDPANGPALPEGTVVSPDTGRADRLPPGQVVTRKWPVLDASGTPDIDLASWQFDAGGLVSNPWRATFAEFRDLPAEAVYADFHCVTRWSKLGILWEGVRTATIAGLAGVDPRARFVRVHGCDGGWTTNMPLEDFLSSDALFAWSADGAPLEPDHGGPLRLVVPRLYAWKSAKWVRAVTFLEDDAPGYWESGGYHMRGDPWREQRFRWS